MLRRLPWRTFFTALILALCVLGLLCAFLIIEYNIRQTTYGQVDLGVTYTLEDGIPAVRVGEGEPLTVPPAAKQAYAVAVPPPVRLFAALWRWECEAAAWFWGFIK